MKKQILSVLIVLLGALGASAGKEKGGGDTIACGGGVSGFFQYGPGNWGKSHLLADIYNSENKLDTNFLDFVRQEELDAAVLKTIYEVDSAQALKIQIALSRLSFQMTDLPLDELPDHVEISGWKKFIHGCSKSQLAIQDFKTGIVTIYRPHFLAISRLERLLLKVHEAFVNIEQAATDDYMEMEQLARQNLKTVYENPRFNQVLLRNLFEQSKHDWNHIVDDSDQAELKIATGGSGELPMLSPRFDVSPGAFLYKVAYLRRAIPAWKSGAPTDIGPSAFVHDLSPFGLCVSPKDFYGKRLKHSRSSMKSDYRPFSTEAFYYVARQACPMKPEQEFFADEELLNKNAKELKRLKANPADPFFSDELWPFQKSPEPWGPGPN